MARHVSRIGDRLIRLAYEIENVAARLRAAGEGDAARGVLAISSELGNIGRDLDDRLGAKQ